MAQGLSIELIAAAMVGVATLFAGSVLVTFGLRGRRIDQHPVCRRCRFDLLGLAPAAAACPECGADLSRRRAVRIGQRRRRRGMLWCGSGCLLLVPAVLVLGYTASARGWSLYQTLPASWLLAVVDPAQPSGGEAALGELMRRARQGSLAPKHLEALVTRALARQADPNLPWSEAWGEPLAVAFLADALTREQVDCYVRNAMQPRLVLRSPAAAGERSWPIGFELPGTRVGSQSYAHPQIVATLQSVEVGGVALDLSGHRPNAGMVYLHPPSASSHLATVSTDAPLDVEPGTHPVRALWQISVLDAPATAPAMAPAVSSWTLTLEGEVAVLPAGTPVVALVADESMRERIETMIRPDAFTYRRSGGPSTLRAVGQLTLSGTPPMPLAFEIFWRAGGREWRVGSMSMRHEPAAPQTVMSLTGELPGFDPEAVSAVDLILRASPEKAAADPAIDRIWHGEIIIRDVPITAPAGGAPGPGAGR